MSGSTQKGNGTTVTSIDPELKADWTQVFQQAQDLSDKLGGMPVGLDKVAPQAADTQHADTYLNSNLTAGVPQLNQAEKLALDVGKDSPKTIDPVKANNFAAQAARVDPANGYKVDTLGRANTFDAARIDPNKVGDVTAQGLPDVNIRKYTNLYDDQVVNNAIADNERARQIQQQNDKASAIAAGAFGGSREGVQRAQTNDAYQRNIGDQIASLRQGGYTQAQNLAEADLGRDLTADQGNQSTRLNLFGQNAGFQQQARATNTAAQNTNQQLDAAAKNTEHAFKASGQNTVDLTNAANKQAVNLNNAQSATGTSQFNTGQINAAKTQNAANDLAGNSQALGAAQLLGSLGGQEMSRVAGNVGLLNNQGQINQGYAQSVLDAAKNNANAKRQGEIQDLQVAESPFQLIPNTGSGGTSTTNSSGKGIGI